ncbi:hypothetical protein L7F22_012647 [Adiantum nelumboides]|nr:hypothetical protein [Adiantum nelumboides]
MVGGSETELFRWPSAQLYLLDGDERALLQRGPFRLFLAMHALSPHLVAVEAIVSDVQWPVGKDCTVAAFTGDKVHSITFALQHESCLVYELVLDEGEGYGTHMDRLEQLLRLYSNFDYPGKKTFNNKNTVVEENFKKNYPRVNMGGICRSTQPPQCCDHTRFQDVAEAELNMEALQLSLAGTACCDRQASMYQDQPTTSVTRSSGGTGVIPGASRRIMKRMHQARRISAVTKLFSKALERGAIRPKKHIEVHNMVPEQYQAVLVGCGVGVSTAVADVDMVAKVVELVEKRTTLGEVVRQEKVGRPRGGWTLNELGLHLLLKAVVAANMIASSHTHTHTT